MSDEALQMLLAQCVEDYHRRRALGEKVSADQYRDRLGANLGELVAILEAESALDGVVDPKEDAFPRPLGEYTLLRELGRGAMGVVYEAVHRRLGRKVALKVLRSGFDTEPEAIERFRREARACAQVKHPNVVEIYDAGEEDGRPYYSMEFLVGRSLYDVAADETPPDPKTLCAGLAGIASALAALNKAGIVHRDVKPANIIVRPDGSMVLADFGLARTVDSERLTATGQALGTPLYMSPEQILGQAKEIDGRADVYGLGATIYEVLAKRRLFEAEGMPALLRAILQERPVALREHRPDLPRDFDHVVMKALEKKKEDRYQTADELEHELRRLAAGQAVEGRAVSPTQRALRAARRYAPIAAAVLVAVGLSAAYLVRDTARSTRDEIAQAQAVADVPLQIACLPGAEVLIDGTSKGRTPLELVLRPGRYELQLREAGFRDRAEALVVEPAQARSIERVLVAADPKDPAALAKIAEALGLDTGALETRTAHRAGDDSVLVPVFPRGACRAADLATIRVDVSAEFEAGGVLRFTRGDEVLWEQAFDPEKLVTVAELPASVRERLRPGDVIAWGYVPKAGEPVLTSFRVVDDGVGKETLDRVAAFADQPAIAGRLRTRAMLANGLALAAYREASAAAQADPQDADAWTAAQAALDALELTGSAPWIEAANGRHRAAPR